MNKLQRYCSGTPTLTKPSSDGQVSALAHMLVRNSSSVGGGKGVGQRKADGANFVILVSAKCSSYGRCTQFAMHGRF